MTENFNNSEKVKWFFMVLSFSLLLLPLTKFHGDSKFIEIGDLPEYLSSVWRNKWKTVKMVLLILSFS